ncbi:NAD(P)-binding domain-containing protein [Psychrosphaera ytuae]|uniref:NAD(P)-binding domain-containing protein n=1 Tax=Psychrosphaera ytuae TaxID=2820710 RepID=A0A975DAV0_9GAMM|nr:NAD(P)-binding domain-containing protein [Psychrosphaera ytuae]QTH63369.1 NAD(P)-binding domain-containing protein [Psychrosphaera ytuae]
MQRVGIIGGGFIGTALAEALVENSSDKQKYQVCLSFRTSRQKLTNSSINQAFCNVSDGELNADEVLFNVDSLVICIPPGFKKGLGDSYSTKIKSLVEKGYSSGVKQIIFTSSIGIYPEGAEVDENTALDLSTEKARALYDAEQEVLTSRVKNKQVIRLAGLIGATRHPGRFKVKLTADNALEPVNMVTQKDVVAAIKLLLEQGARENNGDIYNVVAPHHPSKQSFYRYARQQLNDERINEPLVVPEVAPTMARNTTIGKRVSGLKICHKLGFEYQTDNLLRFVFS